MPTSLLMQRGAFHERRPVQYPELAVLLSTSGQLRHSLVKAQMVPQADPVASAYKAKKGVVLGRWWNRKGLQLSSLDFRRMM
jgi:hypothetical protein